MNTASINGVSEPPSAQEPPLKLKILMLHGYTQTGPLFHAKTRSLEKALHKSFPPTRSSPLYALYPGGVQLIYPTGPILLQPADIPTFSPAFTPSPATTSTPTSTTSTPPNDTEAPSSIDAYAWWTRDATTGEYTGLSEGLSTIYSSIVSARGIHGVIGFSQGGCCAAFIASLLETSRAASFAKYHATHPTSFPYPEPWTRLAEEVGQEPLKFAISYSGFYAPDERYGAFYEPRIWTRMLSVMGGLDSVVEEDRTRGLVERCVEGRVTEVVHPGGHFVPLGKEWVGVVSGFIRDACMDGEKKKAGDGTDGLGDDQEKL